jgi:hypothetical protein
MADTPTKNDFSRVFIIENQAGPANVPDYQGQTIGEGIDWSLGDTSPIQIPNPNRYGDFIEVGQIAAEKERPTTSLRGRYPTSLSDMLRVARQGCPFDAQIHIGTCQNPQDFDGGWDKIVVYEGAKYSSYSTDELGALESGDRAAVGETGDLSATDLYEIVRMGFVERGGDIVSTEIIGIVVCDTVSCGDC